MEIIHLLLALIASVRSENGTIGPECQTGPCKDHKLLAKLGILEPNASTDTHIKTTCRQDQLDAMQNRICTAPKHDARGAINVP